MNLVTWILYSPWVGVPTASIEHQPSTHPKCIRKPWKPSNMNNKHTWGTLSSWTLKAIYKHWLFVYPPPKNNVCSCQIILIITYKLVLTTMLPLIHLASCDALVPTKAVNYLNWLRFWFLYICLTLPPKQTCQLKSVYDCPLNQSPGYCNMNMAMASSKQNSICWDNG